MLSLKENDRKCLNWSLHIFQDFIVLKARLGVHLGVLFHTFLFRFHFFLFLIQTEQSVLTVLLGICLGMLFRMNMFFHVFINDIWSGVTIQVPCSNEIGYKILHWHHRR